MKKLLTLLILSFSLITYGVTVVLEWDPSLSPNVVSYVVYYGTSSRVYTNMTDLNGPYTNATVAGLVENRTYFFAVTAVADNGLESDYSDELAYTVPTIGNLIRIKSVQPYP